MYSFLESKCNPLIPFIQETWLKFPWWFDIDTMHFRFIVIIFKLLKIMNTEQTNLIKSIAAVATHAEDRVFESRPQQIIGETDRIITSTKCLATGVNVTGP